MFGCSLQDSHNPLMPSLAHQHDCMHHTVPQSPAQPNPNPEQDAPSKSNPNQPGTRHRGEEGSRLIKNIISPGRGEPLAKISQEGPSIGGNQPLGREAHKRDQRGVTSPLRGREGRSFPRETTTKKYWGTFYFRKPLATSPPLKTKITVPTKQQGTATERG